MQNAALARTAFLNFVVLRRRERLVISEQSVTQDGRENGTANTFQIRDWRISRKPVPEKKGRPVYQFPCRIARALRARLDDIEDEQEACLRQRDLAYQLADALLDEFDDLTAERQRLRDALWRLEGRLAAAARRAEPVGVAA